MSYKDDVKKTLIYCGPSFEGLLQQYSIFKGGIPGHLNEHMEKCPAIKELLVPPSKLPLTRSEIKRKGSKENELFKKISNYQKGDE